MLRCVRCVYTVFYCCVYCDVFMLCCVSCVISHRHVRLRQAFGPFRLVIEETVTWTFPPIPYQLPSHRVFATFVLLSVLSVILCCLLGLFWMQMRGSQEEGLLDEHNEGGEELTENVGGAATPPASPASGAKGDGL